MHQLQVLESNKRERSRLKLRIQIRVNNMKGNKQRRAKMKRINRNNTARPNLFKSNHNMQKTNCYKIKIKIETKTETKTKTKNIMERLNLYKKRRRSR